MTSRRLDLEFPREGPNETPHLSVAQPTRESSGRSRPVSNTSHVETHEQLEIHPAQPSLEQSESEGSNLGPLRGNPDVSDEDVNSPWAEKTVLALDGGGIRGYSSLLILRALMSTIQRLEQPERGKGPPVNSSADYPWKLKDDDELVAGFTDSANQFHPCHYFDYVAGTSTGGLSAIMLGRLRMSVDEALRQYTEFGNAVFGKARWWHERSILYFPRAKYPSRKARRAIVSVIDSNLVEKDSNSTLWGARHEPFSSNPDQTRTMVIAFSKDKKEGIEEHYLFRSYNHDDDVVKSRQTYQPMTPGPACNAPLCEVARATSAAPRYFESITFMNRKFLDGGLGANNPAKIAFHEVDSMHAHPPALLVSIGTGEKKPLPKKKKRDQARELLAVDRTDEISRKQFLKKYLELTRFMKDFTTNTEGIANDTKWAAQARKTPHRRFNVTEGLGTIPLDDWRPARSGAITLADITRYTQDYLDSPEIQEDLEFCAQELVDRRRRRARTERWENFATDVQYYCPERSETCRASRYKERKLLREHYRYHHPEVSSGDLEAKVDCGRILKGSKPRGTNTGLGNGDGSSMGRARPNTSPSQRRMTNGVYI